ncbi:KilA-N domain-containing protein [Acinetobacter schindleri]|jgi:hypothetical protein|uniref:KilA-N domain-containing protein n=2 Tax=Acinetobacter schindleri TaxID=108981 RepID=UPI00289A260A|nr:KilA-N domain-containing protein [Acinetobacter schindleri]
MNTIQQNLLNPNYQPLMIGNFAIHQDEDGRYCLNDLHKASGGDKKHQPAYFIRNQQTKDLITEIVNSANLQSLENSQIEPVKKMEGVKGGTYVVKELVYSYAMWISAKFHLIVIRAYDALVMQWKINDRKTISPEQQAVLHEIVDRCSKGERKIYAEMWSRHNRHFRIPRYSELLAIHFQDAVDYLETMQIKAKGDVHIDENQSIEMLCSHARLFQAWWNTHSPILAKLNPQLVYMLHDNMFSMNHSISDLCKKFGISLPTYDYDHMFELKTLPHERYRLLK